MVGGSHNYQKTELVALSADGPVPDCLSDLKDHPNKVYLGAGGALSDRGEMKLKQGDPSLWVLYFNKNVKSKLSCIATSKPSNFERSSEFVNSRLLCKFCQIHAGFGVTNFLNQRNNRKLFSTCFTDDLPHVCGSYYPPYDECWRYSPSNDSWTKTSITPREGRYVEGWEPS